jgi:NhaP-type Na+/H+ or K+/H+ antiporter
MDMSPATSTYETLLVELPDAVGVVVVDVGMVVAVDTGTVVDAGGAVVDILILCIGSYT